ncbi:MAG TPA: hypothetical protein VMT35_04225 [Ignavibacteriaceae bacterium]|nr:hypothetical protein [Ignavibacteriaceae bacterium]
MKSISVYNISIKEKKLDINDAWYYYFISPSRLGLSWFLILFFTVFFLETMGYLISRNKNFQFDVIDLAIASAGFVLGFFTKFFDNYQKKFK